VLGQPGLGIEGEEAAHHLEPPALQAQLVVTITVLSPDSITESPQVLSGAASLC
jgi:hypothetical protein